MATSAWTDATPGSGDKLGDGDDRIREDKKNVRERLLRGGHYFADASYIVAGDDTDHEGKHIVGVGAGPHVWRSDKTTKLVDFTNDTTVDMTNATSGILGPGITTGTDPGHTHTRSMVVVAPGTLTTGRIKAFWRVPVALTLVRAHFVVGTPPSGGSMIFQAYEINAPTSATDRTAAGTGDAFWLPGSRPTILVGTYSINTTTFDGAAGTAVDAGDEIAFEIDTVSGSPADLTITLDVRF